MRVLFNGLQAGNRSGTGRYTVELLRALGERTDGTELTVMWPRALPRPVEAENVRYQECDVHGIRRLCLDQFGVRRLARDAAADVIHYPASVGPLMSVPGMVLTIHDLSFLRHPEWFAPSRARYYRHAVARSARKAARVLVDSRATADDVVALLGIPEDRVDVAHLGVSPRFEPSPEDTPALRAKYGLPERFFLYMGTLEPRKNLVRLVETYARVAGGLEQHLVLAGRWGLSLIHI